MRLALPLIALTLCVATPAAALDIPARKPGLWEMKMQFEGRNLPAQVTQNCIDAATDKMMNNFGGGMSRSMCSQQNVRHEGGALVVDSVCEIGPIKTTSHAVMKGSFDSAYTVDVTSKREGGPAMPGMAPGGVTHMKIAARWLGACKAGQHPGDMIMEGGRKINIIEMQKMMPGGMQRR